MNRAIQHLFSHLQERDLYLVKIKETKLKNVADRLKQKSNSDMSIPCEMSEEEIEVLEYLEKSYTKTV